MVNRIRKTSEEDKKQKLNIAGIELSAVLDTNESYDAALKKNAILRQHCLETLGVIENNPLLYTLYNRVMNHYLRNGASYFLGRNHQNSTPKELDESKADYALFMSVIERIDKLTEEQKDLFLQNIKIQHEIPQKMTDTTENVIIVMDRVLSLVEKGKKENEKNI